MKLLSSLKIILISILFLTVILIMGVIVYMAIISKSNSSDIIKEEVEPTSVALKTDAERLASEYAKSFYGAGLDNYVIIGANESQEEVRFLNIMGEGFSLDYILVGGDSYIKACLISPSGECRAMFDKKNAPEKGVNIKTNLDLTIASKANLIRDFLPNQTLDPYYKLGEDEANIKKVEGTKFTLANRETLKIINFIYNSKSSHPFCGYRPPVTASVFFKNNKPIALEGSSLLCGSMD